ncbi:CBS domain-containing protein [Pseudomonas putida]|nr:CBS domain-containing protein [Pseudomonas putida]
MKISEIMSRDVQVVSPDTSLREAAQLMREQDIGSLVVGDNDRMIGVITDRDIVIRGVADGRSLDSAVQSLMSDKVCYCFDSDDVESVAANMADIEKRRLPVVDSEKRLVGIVSLGNLASARQNHVCGEVLQGVAKAH